MPKSMITRQRLKMFQLILAIHLYSYFCDCQKLTVPKTVNPCKELRECISPVSESDLTDPMGLMLLFNASINRLFCQDVSAFEACLDEEQFKCGGLAAQREKRMWLRYGQHTCIQHLLDENPDPEVPESLYANYFSPCTSMEPLPNICTRGPQSITKTRCCSKRKKAGNYVPPFKCDIKNGVAEKAFNLMDSCRLTKNQSYVYYWEIIDIMAMRKENCGYLKHLLLCMVTRVIAVAPFTDNYCIYLGEMFAEAVKPNFTSFDCSVDFWWYSAIEPVMF